MNNSTIDEKRMEFSVLLSTYYKEHPQFFTAALDSVFSQTLPAPEVVLVCDGPLTPELDALIEGYQAQHPEVLKVVRLEKNGGLGNALNGDEELFLRYCGAYGYGRHCLPHTF